MMTRAYTTFANGGRSSELYGIRYIEDQRGRIIAHVEDEMLQKSYAPQNQIMSQQDAYIMADMMKSAFNPGGTFNYGFRMAGGFNGMDMAGKTGTSQTGEMHGV
jgi:membrane peptidoglycan carboxypeptidase